MGRPGPRATARYSEHFKAMAVRLSQMPGIAVQDVAESLYIDPFMLSRWRKQTREGLIAAKHVKRTFRSDQELRGTIQSYMTFYNHFRLHSGLGYCSSVEFESGVH